MERKLCWLLGNVDVSGNLNTGFVPALILFIDFCSSELFVLISIFLVLLHYPELIELPQGHRAATS